MVCYGATDSFAELEHSHNQSFLGKPPGGVEELTVLCSSYCESSNEVITFDKSSFSNLRSFI